MFAILTITPLIVLTATGQVVTAQRRRRGRYGELGILTIALLAVGSLVFSWNDPGPATSMALLFAPLPLLLWAAVRLGSGGLALSLLVVAGLSLLNAFVGRGPFVAQSLTQNVLSLQVFLLAISVPLMLLPALVEERNLGERALGQNEARYRAVVEDQTDRGESSAGSNGWTAGFFDEQRRVVEYQAVGRDITERKRAEEEAQRQREELAHALRVMTLGDGVVRDAASSERLSASTDWTSTFGAPLRTYTPYPTLAMSARAKALRI